MISLAENITYIATKFIFFSNFLSPLSLSLHFDKILSKLAIFIKMNQLEGIQHSLPDDIAVKIVSSLQVSDVCALGGCSRFWRELCGSDCIWAALYRDRWPLLHAFQESSASDTINEGWKGFYIKKHKEIAGGATTVVNFVEGCSASESFEVGDLLKAVEVLWSMRLGFKDVQMFLFKPKLNVLLNLVGVHYCMKWLGVPAEYVIEALQSSNISERQVCVKWWKLGRWFYGFRMLDESNSRSISLGNLPMEDEVLGVLHRGAIHEVLRVQISVAYPPSTPWSFQSMPPT